MGKLHDTYALQLRQHIIEKLTSTGFNIDENGQLYLVSNDKETYKRLHEAARRYELSKHQKWLSKNISRYIDYFANSSDIVVERVEPVLIHVNDKETRNIFRLARLLWSLPYTNGVGRRLRFLVMDRHNNKLIGIIGLQSPPLDFGVRDKLFSYPEGQKVDKVNQTMDIYTLGAVPPYSTLLGGKLIALAAASNEVREVYAQQYGGKRTVIEGNRIKPHLVALTTTSAFGKSSIYNRLKYKNETIAFSLGYVKGYGIFHLLELWPILKNFLETSNISTKINIREGPRMKWRLIRIALNRLGFSSNFMLHGVKREAFLFPLIKNLNAYMSGTDAEPDYKNLPFHELSQWWKTRWFIPRVRRITEWTQWNNKNIISALIIH